MSVVEDARALLRQFAASPWRELHVRTAGGEYFLAKPGGGADPMRGAAGAVAPAAADAAVECTTITAPHVATLVEVAAVGTHVAAGETVATVALLDERIAVASTVAGIVREAAAAPGALLDYGQAILRLEPVAG